MVVRMSASKFDISLEGRQTIVVCKDNFTFLNGNVETDDLWPHEDKECHCVDVQHVTSFRLKTIKKEIYTSRSIYVENNIYIAYEPSDDFSVKCMIRSCKKMGKKGRKRVPSFHESPEFYPGWRYLTTMPCKYRSFEISLKLFKDRPVKYESPTIRAPKLSLSDNMSELFTDGTYSDVTVTSEDGATIKAHRGILAKRSEVFRAALEHNETTDKIITSLNEETLRQIMTYIYTDNTPIIGDFTSDLFSAADFYQLSILKDACISAFYSQLNVENAIATLEVAERHSLTDLLTFTLKFVKNNFDMILLTEDWYNMKSVDLLKIVCEYVAQRSESTTNTSFDI